MSERPKRIKVLLLMHELSLTGAPKQVLDLMEALREDVEIRVVTLREGPLKERFKIHGEVVTAGWFVKAAVSRKDKIRERLRLGAKPDRDFSAWYRYAHDWQPDLVYANCVSSLEVAASLPMPRVPVLSHTVDMGYSLRSMQDWLPYVFTEWPTLYVAGSNATRESLVTECGIDPDRISVVECFVPESFAGETERLLAATRPAKEARGGPLIVGACASLNWRKGTDLWTLMALELRKLVPPGSVKCRWVGVEDDTDGRQFKEMVKVAGIEDFVELLPPTSHVLKEYADFDVFTMPSWSDPFPLVVLENMLMENPVVCFAGSGGPPDEVGPAGVVVPDFDPTAMAREIARLVADPGLRSQLGKAARQRVLERFTTRTQAPMILAHMRALVEGGQL